MHKERKYYINVLCCGLFKAFQTFDWWTHLISLLSKRSNNFRPHAKISFKKLVQKTSFDFSANASSTCCKETCSKQKKRALTLKKIHALSSKKKQLGSKEEVNLCRKRDCCSQKPFCQSSLIIQPEMKQFVLVPFFCLEQQQQQPKFWLQNKNYRNINLTQNPTYQKTTVKKDFSQHLNSSATQFFNKNTGVFLHKTIKLEQINIGWNSDWRVVERLRGTSGA